MRKLFITIFLLVIYLCVFRCDMIGGKVQISTLSLTDKITIQKCDSYSGEVVHNATIESEEQIKHICNNFSSLSLNKTIHTTKTKGIKYNLTFYNNDNEVETIRVTSEGWIDYDDRFLCVLKGKIDIEYIDSLFEHTYIWHIEEMRHIKTYTCGCLLKEEITPHYDKNEDGYCDECDYNPSQVEKELSTKSIVGCTPLEEEEFKIFIKRFCISEHGYIIIDNYEFYSLVFSNLPKLELELLSEEMAKTYFENNVIIINLRYISGSVNMVPVKYYYNSLSETVRMEYVNLIDENGTYDKILLYCLDIIHIPKTYFEKLNK